MCALRVNTVQSFNYTKHSRSQFDSINEGEQNIIGNGRHSKVTYTVGKGRQLYMLTSFPASIPQVSTFFLVFGEATSSNRLAMSAG